MTQFFKIIRHNYASTEGRTDRKTFWVFSLINTFFFLVFLTIDLLTIIYLEDFLITGYFSMIYAVVLFLPSLSILIRRLHDVGKSGWFTLLLLIPLIGLIGLTIFLFKKSNTGENRFGSSPEKF